MSLITGANAVGIGTASTTLLTVPPGPCTVLVSNNGTQAAFLGAGTASVTSTNGYPVPSGQQTAIPCYAGSGGSPLKVTVSAGTITAGGIGWMISTSAGGTGP